QSDFPLLRDANVRVARTLDRLREVSNPAAAAEPLSPHQAMITRRFELEALRAQEQLRDAEYAAAQFSAIDGALVIDSSLRVLGFGVFFGGGSSAEAASIEEIDPFVGPHRQTRPLHKLGGARHQSAARFCSQLPEGVVLVASEDGGLSVVSKFAESIMPLV